MYKYIYMCVLFSWLKPSSGIAESFGSCTFQCIEGIDPFFWSGCVKLPSQQKHMRFSFSAFSPTLHDVVLFVCSWALPVNKVLSHSSFNWHFPSIVDWYCWAFVYIFGHSYIFLSSPLLSFYWVIYHCFCCCYY